MFKKSNSIAVLCAMSAFCLTAQSKVFADDNNNETQVESPKDSISELVTCHQDLVKNLSSNLRLTRLTPYPYSANLAGDAIVVQVMTNLSNAPGMLRYSNEGMVHSFDFTKELVKARAGEVTLCVKDKTCKEGIAEVYAYREDYKAFTPQVPGDKLMIPLKNGFQKSTKIAGVKVDTDEVANWELVYGPLYNLVQQEISLTKMRYYTQINNCGKACADGVKSKERAEIVKGLTTSLDACKSKLKGDLSEDLRTLIDARIEFLKNPSKDVE